MKTRTIFGLAFLICLWQVLFAFVLTPNVGGLAARYDRFNEWDSNHYNRIIDNGYSMPEGRPWVRSDIHTGAANVMFFPGYLIASHTFKEVTGISTRVSMLIIAQFACWIFWVYFLLILARSGATRRGLLIAVFLILIHPATFYLVMGYTESTFLAALLGFIYWSERMAQRAQENHESGNHKVDAWYAVEWLFSAAHAVVMGFTRIVSFAAAPYPTLAQASRGKTRPPLKTFLSSPRSFIASYVGPYTGPWFASMALAIFAICGTFFYFYYLKQRFGDWTLYFKLEEVGWGNHRQWLAIVNPLSYIPRFFFEDTRSSINRLSNLSVVLFFVYLWKKEKLRSDSIKRFGLYFTAFFLYFIPITGKAAAEMDSMVRYNLPSTVLLALCLGVLLREQTPGNGQAQQGGVQKIGYWGRIFRDPATGKIHWGLAFGAFVVFAIQVSNIYRFLRGGWIA